MAFLLTTGALFLAPTSASAQPGATFLIPTESGPVHYPACAGPITWSLDPAGIEASGSDELTETAMWREIFTDIAATTGYSFTQVPANDNAANDNAANHDASNDNAAPATIVIDYTTDATRLGLDAPEAAFTTVAIGGITDLAWSGSSWVATRSAVMMNPVVLHSWRKDPKVRPWAARHELGHALGLGHSADETSVMVSRYDPRFTTSNYSPDDREAMRSLAAGTCPPAG